MTSSDVVVQGETTAMTKAEVEKIGNLVEDDEWLGLATELVRPGGAIVLKTTTHDVAAPSPTPWVIDEVTVLGSRCGPFAPALRLLTSGAVDPRPLITEERALDDGVAALARAAEPDAVKVLLRVAPG